MTFFIKAVKLPEKNFPPPHAFIETLYLSW